jgi:uncharacterized membrane protein
VVVDSAGATIPDERAARQPGAGGLHLVRVVLGLVLLTAPGVLLFRRLVPDGGLAEAVGMVPTLAMVLLAFAGIAALSVVRAPFSAGVAWGTLALAGALAALLAWRRPRARA